MPHRHSKARIIAQLKSLDLNHDGMLSAEEIHARRHYLTFAARAAEERLTPLTATYVREPMPALDENGYPAPPQVTPKDSFIAPDAPIVSRVTLLNELLEEGVKNPVKLLDGIFPRGIATVTLSQECDHYPEMNCHTLPNKKIVIFQPGTATSL
ncbi:MAG: hypothetical protein WDN72_01720 [Alphaproteobacteria bacterium]